MKPIPSSSERLGVVLRRFARPGGVALLLGAALLWPAGVARAQSAAAAEVPVAPAMGEDYRVPDDWRELLQVDDEMRRFFDKRLAGARSSEDRIEAIVAAILGKDGLNFRYRGEASFDARETFRRRQGNCVAFSILVVAVAREYKLTARFNEFRTAPRWDRMGQIVVEIRHLNVLVHGDSSRVLVDLLPSPPGVERIESMLRPVSDADAFALFYGNNGVYLLGRGRAAEALPLLQRATTIAPSLALGWVNLGHGYLVIEDTERARACYERALREEPRDLNALSSLARLCRSTGQIERAQQLERKTERFRERNPYYLAELARRDLAADDPAAAERRLRRALQIKEDAPEFYELAIEAARRLERAKDVRRWTARLEKLRAALAASCAPSPEP